MEDRALALDPDKGVLLIRGVEQGMDQVRVIRRFDLLDIDRISRHKFSIPKLKNLPQVIRSWN